MKRDRFRLYIGSDRIGRHQKSGEWPQPGLAELTQRRRAECADAVLFVDGALRLNADQFASRVESLAAGLLDLGLGPGDVISWELPSWWEAAVVAVAIDHIGAVSNPIIPIYRQREVGFIVRQARTRAFFMPAVFRGFDFRDLARDVQRRNPCLEHLIVVRGEALPGMRSFSDLGQGLDAPPLYERPPADVAMIFYTSGTTADPKGVLHTNDTMGAYVAASVEATGVDENEVALLQFPLTHIGGLASFVATPLLVGSRTVLLDAWTPEAAINLIEEEAVTSAGGPPVILQGLMSSPALRSERVRTLRVAGTGAAGIPSDLVSKVGVKLEAQSFRAYGLTECPMVTTGRPDDAEGKRSGTDGRASPGCEVRVVDGKGNAVAPGAEGEVEAFGPQLFVGYVDQALNGNAFTTDGFLRTGDLGVLDADGYLRITGRLKDVIVRKGENLSAQAMEDILSRHADIADVAVIGLPDEDSGERACAVIVVRPDASPPNLEAIAAFMSDQQVMRQMIPEQIEVVESLPRNATGKVLKFVLQERIRRRC